MGKIILTSQGLCTQMGDRLIHRVISDMGDRENKKILLVDIKKYRVTEKLKEACISMGFEKSNIFATSEAEAGGFPDSFEYYYVTAGNTFEILKEIRIKKLAGLIKRSMLENNATYIGSSAGAMIAGIDVRLALDFDRDMENLDDYRALSLFNGTVIPHYSKADLRRYIKNTDSDVLAGYDKIYSVNDNEALIGEFEKNRNVDFQRFSITR